MRVIDYRLGWITLNSISITSSDLCFADECLSSPCLNGNCSNGLSFECQCVPDFTGRQCETRIDDCTSNPCINGKCMDGINSYTCICYPGFTGENCTINIDDCSPSVCQNNGTCEDRVDDFICSCPDTYAGKTCERQSSCSPEQDNCTNNGVCNASSTEGIIETSCECLPGYTGLTCESEIDECLSDPCENSGICIDLIGRFQCLCPAGLTGDRCQTNEDLCATSPCQNGAICIETTGGTSTICFCRNGFMGDFCQTNINECLGMECLNGGTCVDGIATYSYNCTDDFMGERCEIPMFSPCASLPCANGGTCISVNSSAYSCTCPTGFTGPKCTIQLITPDPNCTNPDTNCTIPDPSTDPNYMIHLTSDATQDPSDPCQNLIMVIQNQATFNLVAIALSSSVTVFVLSSVIFFAFGCICGYKCKQSMTSGQAGVNVGHDTEVTHDQPAQQNVQSEAREQDIELNENVAYEPVYEDILP